MSKKRRKKHKIDNLNVDDQKHNKIDEINEEETDHSTNSTSNSSSLWRDIFRNIIQVELAVGAIIIIWYTVTYFYHAGIFTFYKIPLFYLDITLDKLMLPGPFFLIALFIILLIYWNIKWSQRKIPNIIFDILLFVTFIFVSLKYELSYILMNPKSPDILSRI
ncbi:hypothetical protein [Laceyella putida]|uniref:Uncharacterized protein n=1 Tax=Laceyella putida TaxID=110101 RepID=A0ABW2RIJ2_9BACL